MDIKQIQELVKLINKTNIGEITIEEDGVKITVKQKKDPRPIISGGGSFQASAPVLATTPSIPIPPPARSEHISVKASSVHASVTHTSQYWQCYSVKLQYRTQAC